MRPKEFFSVFFKNRLGIIGLMIIAAFILMAVFAPILAPFDPYVRAGTPFLKPDGQFWLGTNDIGQDIFSEIIYGSRISLIMGFSSAFMAITIGSLAGLTAGYFGGKVDTVIMRLVDAMLVIPSMPLMILIAAFLGSSFWNIVMVIGFLSWCGPARVIRAQVLTTKNRGYVEAVKTLGGKPWYIIFKHILPSALSIIISQLILMSSQAILTEASLSFLGLGDPTHKSWGIILYYAQARSAFLTDAWIWWILPAGLMITFLVLSFAYVGNAMEEIVNPKLRRD